MSPSQDRSQPINDLSDLSECVKGEGNCDRRPTILFPMLRRLSIWQIGKFPTVRTIFNWVS